MTSEQMLESQLRVAIEGYLKQRERAERAEAEVEMAREARNAMVVLNADLAAALARVRELCDTAFNEQGYDFSCFEHDLNAALEGDQ